MHQFFKGPPLKSPASQPMPHATSSAAVPVAACASSSVSMSANSANHSHPSPVVPHYDNLQEYIDKNKVHAEILNLGIEMKTSDIAAARLNTSLHQIFKSLVLQDAKKRVAIVVLPGDYHLDLAAVCTVLNWGNYKKISFAKPDVVIARTGYPGGGTPPFGHREQLPVILDESMLSIPEGYGGGGRYECMVRIAPQEIIRVTGAAVAKISVEMLAAAPPSSSSPPASPKAFS